MSKNARVVVPTQGQGFSLAEPTQKGCPTNRNRDGYATRLKFLNIKTKWETSPTSMTIFF